MNDELAGIYRTAVDACNALADVLDPDHYLRSPVRTIATCIGRHLPATHDDDQEVSARWRAERQLWEEWRASSAYAEFRETYRGVPIANTTACALAHAAVGLQQAATMSDEELLKIEHMGLVGLGRLRAFLVGRVEGEVIE